MEKIMWKPGTMVYPVPAVIVSCGQNPEDYNLITIAWTGTVCSDPAMTYISVRKERHSHSLIKQAGEFVINLTTEALVHATDLCGVKSGKDINKFSATKLTPQKSNHILTPGIAESPISIECRVSQILELGSHDMFLAEVLCVNVDPQYLDEKGKFHLNHAKPICYSHGQYYSLAQNLGHFGFSVAKNK